MPLSPSSQYFLALALHLALALFLFQRSSMTFDHGKITKHQKVVKFPAVEMPSEMTGHTSASRQGWQGAEHQVRLGIWSKSKIKSKSKNKKKHPRQSARVSRRCNFYAFALRGVFWWNGARGCTMIAATTARPRPRPPARRSTRVAHARCPPARRAPSSRTAARPPACGGGERWWVIQGARERRALLVRGGFACGTPFSTRYRWRHSAASNPCATNTANRAAWRRCTPASRIGDNGGLETRTAPHVRQLPPRLA